MVSIIVAIDDKRGIGKDNDLLFKISEDFKRMKALTTGHPIILGRKTYESIGRLLPNRTNIIVTRDPGFQIEGAVICGSLEEAIAFATSHSGERKRLQNPDSGQARMTDSEEIFIFGGGQIFKEALEKGLVDRLYLTVVKGDYGADTFFPDYEKFGFNKIVAQEDRESDDHKYSFITLEK